MSNATENKTANMSNFSGVATATSVHSNNTYNAQNVSFTTTVNAGNSDTITLTKWLSRLISVNQYQAQNETLQKATPGTCEWILKEPQLVKWIDTQSGLIWGMGVTGAGKTTLASVLINALKSKINASKAKITLLWFYCRDKDEPSMWQILASLLLQLVNSSDDTASFVRSGLYTIFEKEGTDPTRSALESTLKILFTKVGKVVIVVDALDELNELTRADFMKFLRASGAAVFLTSCELFIEGLPKHDLVIQPPEFDIRKFIEDHVNQSPRLRSLLGNPQNAQIRTEVIQTILKKSDGMFILARLQIDALSGVASIKSLRKSIGQSTTLLGDMYKMLLDRIMKQGEEDRTHALRAILWVTWSERPLTSEQLREALAVEPGSTVIDKEAVVDESYLLSVTCGLLKINPTAGVFLIHRSAYDYFKTLKTKPFDDPHTFAAEVCTTYRELSNIDRSGKDLSPESLTALAKKEHPFLDYAITEMGTHAYRSSQAHNGDLPSRVKGFLSKHSTGPNKLLLPSVSASKGSKVTSQRDPFDVGNADHFAALHGLTSWFSKSTNQTTKGHTSTPSVGQRSLPPAGQPTVSQTGQPKALQPGNGPPNSPPAVNQPQKASPPGPRQQNPSLPVPQQQNASPPATGYNAGYYAAPQNGQSNFPQPGNQPGNRPPTIPSALNHQRNASFPQPGQQNVPLPAPQQPNAPLPTPGYPGLPQTGLRNNPLPTTGHAASYYNPPPGNGQFNFPLPFPGQQAPPQTGPRNDALPATLQRNVSQPAVGQPNFTFPVAGQTNNSLPAPGQPSLPQAQRTVPPTGPGHAPSPSIGKRNAPPPISGPRPPSVSAAGLPNVPGPRPPSVSAAGLPTALQSGQRNTSQPGVGHRTVPSVTGRQHGEPMTVRGRTPFMYACAGGKAPTIKYLLEHTKPNIDATDKAGYTAVDIAAHHGLSDVVKTLLKSGASITKGKGALQVAAKAGQTDVVRVLLTSPESSRDAQKVYPAVLDTARKLGHTDVADSIVTYVPAAKMGPGPRPNPQPAKATPYGMYPQASSAPQYPSYTQTNQPTPHGYQGQTYGGYSSFPTAAFSNPPASSNYSPNYTPQYTAREAGPTATTDHFPTPPPPPPLPSHPSDNNWNSVPPPPAMPARQNNDGWNATPPPQYPSDTTSNIPPPPPSHLNDRYRNAPSPSPESNQHYDSEPSAPNPWEQQTRHDYVPNSGVPPLPPKPQGVPDFNANSHLERQAPARQDSSSPSLPSVPSNLRDSGHQTHNERQEQSVHNEWQRSATPEYGTHSLPPNPPAQHQYEPHTESHSQAQQMQSGARAITPANASNKFSPEIHNPTQWQRNQPAETHTAPQQEHYNPYASYQTASRDVAGNNTGYQDYSNQGDGSNSTGGIVQYAAAAAAVPLAAGAYNAVANDEHSDGEDSDNDGGYGEFDGNQVYSRAAVHEDQDEDDNQGELEGADSEDEQDYNHEQDYNPYDAGTNDYDYGGNDGGYAHPEVETTEDDDDEGGDTYDNDVGHDVGQDGGYGEDEYGDGGDDEDDGGDEGYNHDDGGDYQDGGDYEDGGDDEGYDGHDGGHYDYDD